jgi:hypothetical protein
MFDEVEGDVFRVSEMLRKTICFGLGVIQPVRYGVPVTLAVSELRSDSGFAIGVPVKIRWDALRRLSEPV